MTLTPTKVGGIATAFLMAGLGALAVTSEPFASLFSIPGAALVAVAVVLFVIAVYMAVQEHRRVPSDQGGRPFSWLRDIRLRSPLYFNETKDGLLVNARITARAEALRQIEVETRDAKAEASTLRQHLATARATIESLRDTNQTLEARVSAAENETRRERDVNQYGMAFEEPPPIPPEAGGVVRMSLQKIKRAIDVVERAAMVLWNPLKEESSRQPASSPIGWIRANIEFYEFRFRENASNELNNRLIGNQDGRYPLTIWWRAYAAWRADLAKLAAILGKQLQEMKGYDEWRAAEKELLKLIEVETACDEFALFSGHAALSNRAYGTLANDPPYFESAEIGEYGALVRRLKSATPDESKFLALFVDRGPAMMPGHPDTYLDHAVFRAGEALVSTDLMTLRVDEISQHHFTLTPLGYRAWLATEMVQPTTRTVCIDLNTLHGTGSSGGGR